MREGGATPSTLMRSHGACAIRTSAQAHCGKFSRKCAARIFPKDSGESKSFFFASAYTVFFIVSVGMQAELSPCVYTRSKAPPSMIPTVSSSRE